MISLTERNALWGSAYWYAIGRNDAPGYGPIVDPTNFADLFVAYTEKHNGSRPSIPDAFTTYADRGEIR